MTIEEAKKMLTNTKVYVNGKSKEIQEKLFEIGFKWSSGSGQNVSFTNAPFLFIKEDIFYSFNMQTFKEESEREVSAEDIINIKIDEEFVPKHGDIISIKSDGYSYIEIFDKFEDKQLWCSYYICVNSTMSANHRGFLFLSEIKEISLSTKEEKDMLFYALRLVDLFYNEKTKEVEKIHKEHEFKPFDKVLVRDEEDEDWRISLFAQKETDADFPYRCMGEVCSFCIPYKGNEHLLGTSNSPEE